ncbi:hypothetical protein ABZP36_000381 [Zizania latifolia]
MSSGKFSCTHGDHRVFALFRLDQIGSSQKMDDRSVHGQRAEEEQGQQHGVGRGAAWQIGSMAARRGTRKGCQEGAAVVEATGQQRRRSHNRTAHGRATA